MYVYIYIHPKLLNPEPLTLNRTLAPLSCWILAGYVDLNFRSPG